ncbi:MAG: M4 family metallopeptidase [Taibaiella sp.]|nr:M4 family metallopeptidase [Taibaiella sp.]
MIPFSRGRFRCGTLALATAVLLGGKAVAQQKNTSLNVQSVVKNEADKTFKSITLLPGTKWIAGNEAAFFKQYLGLNGVDNKMVFKNTTTTRLGITTNRYSQFYKGIKAEHGDYTVTIKDGTARYMGGNYYIPEGGLSTTPSITAAAAFNYAKRFIGAEKYMWEDPAAEAQFKKIRHNPDTTYLPKARLVWVEDLKNGREDKKLYLAYAFEIYAKKPMSRQVVYVNANTGKILFSNSMIHNTTATGGTLYSRTVSIVTSRIGGVFYLFDSTRGNGVYTQSANYGMDISGAVDLPSSTNTWPAATVDSQAIDAHWGGEMVYDYWRTQQSRLSWDNANGILLQYVHLNDPSTGAPYNNAFWNGSEMCYGDGTGVAAGGFDPLTSLDVTAHEIAHGVCQATAALVYNRESGAMNEGFSDCWAATIENWANPYETDAVAKNPWKIGEEIRNGTPLRSMDNPLLQGDPATYNGTNWVDASVAGCPTPSSTTNDNCGVHTNSGVLNHWYYFVVNGGIGTNDLGTAYNVNAIGWTKAADILYQTELALASTDDYAACRAASINAATTLYGPCSAEVQCVTSAWYAVGVGPAFISCTPQIGFTATTLNITENASTTSCPASRTVNIGLKAVGAPITGGSPVANVTVAYGTAVAGVDYSLTSTSLTFAPGDTTTHFATLTLFDNGVVRDNKNLTLYFTLATMGSTAIISPTNDSLQVNIYNNDSIPSYGGPEYHTLNTGTATFCNLTSPFAGNSRRLHSQYLLDATEATAAGLRPGVPVTQIAFQVRSKSSTAPFLGYTVAMGNTTAGNLAAGYATGLTQVYGGNHTTNVGIDSIDFNMGSFTWDGTSNVAVEICYGRNTAAFALNDTVEGIDNNPYIVTNRNGTNGGTGTGCSLTWSGSGTGTARPVMRFKQAAPPAAIETAAGRTRTWDVAANTEVYFYTPTADTNVIAGLDNETANLGCVTATVTQAGNGFTTASFSSANRSRKEILITPTTGAASTTYDVSFYMTNTELAGTAPSSVYLVRTTSATDAGINASNTVFLTPTLTTAPNYVAFKATFTGFGRYFLMDGPLCSAPATTVTAAGATSFCTGGTVALNAVTGTGYTYQWQLGGVDIAGATNSSYTASAAGSYRVVVTQGTCSATSTGTTITVLSLYAAPITGVSGVCIGGTGTVADATAGGSWSSSNPSVASINSSGVITGVTAGTVTITYAVTNSCGTAAVLRTITVSNPSVVGPITGTMNVCPGGSSILADTTAGGVWTTADASIASVNTSGLVTGVGTGTVLITYSVTNATGCTTAVTATVTVNAAPTAVITAAGLTSICMGASVTLNATTGSGLTYQWQRNGINITGATTAAYSASTTGNYTIIITNAGSCSSVSSTVTVTVSTSSVVVPSVTINATPGIVLCTGMTSASFAAVPVNGGTAPAYQWYINGTPASTTATLSYSPASGDVVKVMLTSNAYCAYPDTASNSVVMTFSPYVYPAVSINSYPNDTVCESTIATFTAVPVNGGGSPAYLWTKNGINVATGPSYTYAPADGDVLNLTMISDFLCRLADTALSAPVTVKVDTNVANIVTVTANHTSVRAGQPVTFTATATHGGSAPAYQWYINGTAVPGATNATYTTTTLAFGQVVTCMVQSSEPCATPANAYSAGVTVSVTSSSQQLNTNTWFTLTPNPNNGSFILKGMVSNGADGELAVKVTDILGQVVYTGSAPVANGSVNFPVSLDASLANGIYLANIIAGAENMVFRMVISK